jgi:hypothetical protein
MDTGALTNVTAGGGSVTSAAAVSLGGGRWLVTFLVASSAWGGTPQLHLGITNSATTRATYLGDGVSGVTFEAVTLEAATFSGLGLAEGATRTADNILWTPPAALSQDFELVHIGAQYLVSGDSGLASQTWFEGTAIGETRLLRLSATSAAYREWNGTTAYVDDITRTLPSSGTLFSHFARRRSTPQNVELGYAGVLSGSPTASTGTLQAETAIRIGHSNTASRASHAFNGLLYVPGGLTDSERSALARLTAGSLNYVG